MVELLGWLGGGLTENGLVLVYVDRSARLPLEVVMRV
jgi:hypothetical protein